ncbi:protein yceI precursor [Campylobacter sp. MIT 99-7217]|uniref:YceI family protein n=1 Tax=Campylobacter sp. MIT 99-7217 TaxID=535091 RepID=UPI00115B9048|nr:YceI family protein [Campylobacter sp. MIT 99-7217]TQR30607.1 protein yceI precursor [Campylobacter sp. MIT 99-7217]
MKKILASSLVVASLFATSLSATEFTLDKTHTNVGFKIKHLQISNVSGNFKDYEGLIDFDEASKSFNKIQATIKVASVDTDNQTRDNHLQQDDFFKAKKYPDMTFVMKSYKKVSDTEGKVTGTLTIAGVKKDITLDAEIGGIGEQRGTKKLGFSLSGMIKRSDFKFAKDTSTITLSDEIKLQIDIEANAK